jgi:hypothetical protein
VSSILLPVLIVKAVISSEDEVSLDVDEVAVPLEAAAAVVPFESCDESAVDPVDPVDCPSLISTV